MVDDPFANSENPFAAPISASVEEVELQDESRINKDLRAFVGKKWAYYHKKWESVLDGRDQKTGFNLWAFLFSGIWLPFRKMYFATFVLYAFFLIEAAIQEVLLFKVWNLPELSDMLDNLIGLAVSLIVGANANKWYLSHSQKIVDEVRSEHSDDEAVRRLLSQRGGTSLLSGFVLFMLFLFALIGVFALISPEDF